MSFFSCVMELDRSTYAANSLEYYTYVGHLTHCQLAPARKLFIIHGVLLITVSLRCILSVCTSRHSISFTMSGLLQSLWVSPLTWFIRRWDGVSTLF